MSRTLLINPTAMEAGLLAAAKARALEGAREAAFEAFARTGLPHKRMEGWKWTDLRAALRDDIAAAEPDNDVIAPSVFGGVKPFEITIMNGAAEWSGAPQGVRIATTRDAALSPLVEHHPLAGLAAAMADEAIEISIAEGAKIDRPILLRRIAGPGAIHARARLSLGAGAAATVIESFDGVGRYFSNSLTETSLGPSASLARFILQDGSEEGVETAVFAATLDAASSFSQVALFLGAKVARIETHIAAKGERAKIDLKSASALSGARHADQTSLILHEAEGATTRQAHKSALKDRANGVFQGKFHVARGAQRTDARMRANALLLSDFAEADHKPELEIYADNVECAHGSTAGALDEDALFYMRQRGLDEDQARALLIEAFLGETFSEIAHPGVQNVFHSRLAHWLKGTK